MLITVADRQRSKEFRHMCELRRLQMRRNLFLLFEENVPKSITGLPYDIWLDKAGSERRVQHNEPRLKVKVDNNNLIPVSIAAEPKILAGRKISKFNKVSKWIQKHDDILMRYWNREINHSDFVDLISRK